LNYALPIILNIFVPHLGQIPVIALLLAPPFPFIVTSLAPDISRFALHLTQYPCTATIVNI